MPLEPEQTEAILDGVPEEAREDLLAATHQRQYAAGEPIVKMGEPGDELFFIVTGRVRVFSGDSEDYAERTLGLLGPGQHFGEAAVLTGGPRTASVTALTFVECLVLDGDHYRHLAQQHPKLLENLARSLRRCFQQDFQTPPRRAKRRLHSVAFVTHSPAGEAAAQGLTGLLRRRGEDVYEMRCVPSEAGNDKLAYEKSIARVTAANLRFEIASRVGGSNVVFVHADMRCAEAAIAECDRIVVAWECSEPPPPELLQWMADHRPRERATIAWLHPKEAQRTPHAVPAGVATIPVAYSKTPSSPLPSIEAPCLVRLDRSMRGLNIGLALGGGGARGLAHIGILETLERAGIVFDSVAGTSAGAIVAAAIAFGLSPQETYEFFAKEMMPPRWMSTTGVGRLVFLMRTFRGRRIEQILRNIGDQVKFEQLRMPLFVTTVDLVSGQQRVRCTGDVVNAILQSINHPVFGSPIMKDGEALVDGGVLINVPASVLRAEKCDRVISIDVGSALANNFGSDSRGRVRRPSYLSTLLRTMEVGRRHATDLHRDESDLLVIPDLGDFRLEDFHALDDLVVAGRKAGERALPEIQKVFAEVEGDA